MGIQLPWYTLTLTCKRFPTLSVYEIYADFENQSLGTHGTPRNTHLLGSTKKTPLPSLSSTTAVCSGSHQQRA
jgi:hypothetical protein